MHPSHPNAPMSLSQVASQGAIVGTRVKPIDRVYSGFDAADELSHRVIALADAICGPEPVNPSAAGIAPAPAGIAHEMADRGDRSAALAREAVHALTRIAEVFK